MGEFVNIETLAEAVKTYDSFAVCGHVNPDGDCLGSGLGLGLALREMGKHVDFLLAEDAVIEPGLHFLPAFDELVPASAYTGSPQAFFSVDVPSTERLKTAAAVRERCEATFTIDHHPVDAPISDYSVVDTSAAATTILIWDLVKALDITPTPDIALCLFTGLMTDTGRFQYQNTDARAFAHGAAMVAAGARPDVAARNVFQNRSLASLELEGRLLNNMELLCDNTFSFSIISADDFAACNAVKSDAEPLIDVLRGVTGVRVACILKEWDGKVRGSLRAKDSVDVSGVAERLGGGGHKAAAGFVFKGTLDEAEAAVKQYVSELLAERS